MDKLQEEITMLKQNIEYNLIQINLQKEIVLSLETLQNELQKQLDIENKRIFTKI